MENPWNCAKWGCKEKADWRDPANGQYGLCDKHATSNEFWPVSDWARQKIKSEI